MGIFKFKNLNQNFMQSMNLSNVKFSSPVSNCGPVNSAIMVENLV